MLQLRPHQQRALEAMNNDVKGQIIVPTGGGKTLIAISDAIREFEKSSNKTIIVVSPRILLAEQLSSEFLEFITGVSVFHCHSGETHHESGTRISKILKWYNNTSGNKLIFTTYHSLRRLVEAEIEVNTIYFDEAHNSVKLNFFGSTAHFAEEAERCYFFTATPKHSNTIYKPGMNDYDVYGPVICNVPAPELVDGGFIVPPKVVVSQMEMITDSDQIAERDCKNLLETIDSNNVDKILVCAKTTKQITALVSETDFCKKVEERGYSWMYITSKTGAVIDGKKVNREVFFDTLSAWGKDNTKKFIVIHHSILSEGINVSGLNAVIFMRSMDFVSISQTIGRVIRLHTDDAEGLKDGKITPGALEQYTKSFGLVCVPVFSKVGIATAKAVECVVDTIFKQGQPAISVIEK
jgi:superfamily II DNA or RNA helicase